MNKSIKDIGFSRQKANFIRHTYIEDMENICWLLKVRFHPVALTYNG